MFVKSIKKFLAENAKYCPEWRGKLVTHVCETPETISQITMVAVPFIFTIFVTVFGH
jgi:hypothetical protein